MEKAERISTVAGFGSMSVAGMLWLGCMRLTTTAIVLLAAKVYFVEAEHSREITSHTEKVIAAIGVDNMVIIDTPDALSITDRAKSQDKTGR